MLPLDQKKFVTTVEVVPPAGPDPRRLLDSLSALEDLPFHAFSVATHPVAKACMSAFACCELLQRHLQRKTILHLTTRDHNRISLQGLLWGARALGIESVLVATGDRVAMKDRLTTSTVSDLDVFSLVAMARQASLQTGVVFDFAPEKGGLEKATSRLERKIEAGAQFVVTQPIYDSESADELASCLKSVKIPVLMGILPLRSPRHADFLDSKVCGIQVPLPIRQGLHQATDPLAEGVKGAKVALRLARERFQGACVMPPFNHFEILPELLGDRSVSLLEYTTTSP